METPKLYRILEDPMLPPKVGIAFQEFTILLEMDKDYLVPGDVIMINNNEEYQAIIQYLGQEFKEGLKQGYYYTIILITCDKEHFIPNKYLQKDCNIIHIGSAYSM